MHDTMIPDVGFSDNTNQRTPCILVLDGSLSMEGEPIAQLNAGLKVLEENLKADPTAALRVQMLVIRIGDREQAQVVSPWCDAMDFTAPVIHANGTTPLGKGMALALESIQAQKMNYDANGISSTRPWIMIISDGEPNDKGWEDVAKYCREAEAEKKVVIYPIGTAGANFEALNCFSNNASKKLKALNFKELFVWLSRSMTAVSSATPGEVVQLPAADWSEVEV